MSGTRVSLSKIHNSTGTATSSSLDVTAKPRYFYVYEAPFTNGSLGTGSWNYRASIPQYFSSGSAGKGYPVSQTRVGWSPETYQWENGNITSRTFENHTWTNTYYPNSNFLEKTIDIDGQEIIYVYDDFGRLKENKARYSNGTFNTRKEYTYQYKNANNPNNFIRTDAIITSSPNSAVGTMSTFNYLDGLGRSIQSVQNAKSENGYDIIASVAYDQYGRPHQIYEPEESPYSDGRYSTQSGDASHTTKEFELSPIGRELSVTPPSWHTTSVEYGTNSPNEVKIGTTASYYPSGTLMKRTVTDPEGTKSISYTDKRGHQVLSVRIDQSGSKETATRSLYDPKGRVVTVLPPGSTSSSSGLNYKYEYTGYDAVSKKWIPDQAGFTEFRYNTRRLLAATQDPNRRTANEWIANEYDAYGRITDFGLSTGSPNLNNPTFSQILGSTTYGTIGIEKGKVVSESHLILEGATNNWLTTVFDYDAFGRVEQTESNSFPNLNNLAANTATFTYDNLDNLTTTTLVQNVYGSTTTREDRQTFDSWGRAKDSYLTINSGTERLLSNKSYTEKGELMEENLGFVGGSSGWLQSVDYSYNAQGWLTAINGDLNGSNSMITICEESSGGGGDPGTGGGETDPDPGGGGDGERPDYVADPTVKISTNPDTYDLFRLDLRYDDPMSVMGAIAPPTMNGNVSQAIWQVSGREKQTYGYEYDYLSRLTDANHRALDNSDMPSTEGYYSTSYAYDNRGNIEQLYRNGIEADGACWEESRIDNLVYDYYTGTNRLEDVRDILGNPLGFDQNGASNSDKYVYDDNGNMTYDPYKDMHLFYNHLNLPDSIVLPGVTVVNIYTATGEKVGQKTIKSSGTDTKDYINGLEYENGSLEALYHANGRLYYGGGATPEYQYSISDHLGNTRVIFSDLNGNGIVEEANGEILQEHHYYPFGLEMNGPWNNYGSQDSDYRYNGIEHNEELGLDMAMFRSYDPAIGRWMQIDPMAENHYNINAYHHVMNNPISYSDPMGLDTIHVNRNQQATITSGGQDALFLEVSTGLNIRDFLLDFEGLAAGNYTVGEGGDLYQSREFSIAGVKDLIGITVGEAGSGPGEARGIASAILNQFGFDRQSGDVSLADVDGVARFATMYAKYPPDTYTDEQKAGRPYLTIQRLSNNVLFDPDNPSNWGGDRVRGALQAIQLGDHPSAIGATHWEGNSHLTTNSWHNRQVRSGNLTPTTPIPGTSVIGSSTFYRATDKGAHLVYSNR